MKYDAVEGEEREAEIRALESNRLSVPFMGDYNKGTVYSCVTAFNDYDEDGTLDPRELHHLRSLTARRKVRMRTEFPL